MHDVGTIQAINGWSRSAECEAILKNAKASKLKPVKHEDSEKQTKPNDKN